MASPKDFLGNTWEGQCVGCAIADHSFSPPGGLIAETEGIVVHQDPAIPLPGFLVLASKRHVQSIPDLKPSEYDEFAKLLRVTLESVKNVTSVGTLTVVQEEHSTHFHMWFFPWTHDVVEKYGNPSLTKIRQIMRDYRDCELGEPEWRPLLSVIEALRAEVIRRLEM